MQHLYEPIKWWQIRLLKLLPGDTSDVLQGSLHPANVIEGDTGVVLHEENEYVEYQALSYCWGDPELVHEIIVNGKPTCITSSLGHALKRIRRADKEQWFWCDALSINQDDDIEKGHQVQKMFTIYLKATRTIVWLGDGNDSTTALIRWFALPDVERFEEYEEELTQTSQPIRDAMFDLCSRPWIRRAWIQQEIFASRDITVYCGELQISLQDYKYCAKLILTPRSTIQLHAEPREVAQPFGPSRSALSGTGISARILLNMQQATPELRALIELQKITEESSLKNLKKMLYGSRPELDGEDGAICECSDLDNNDVGVVRNPECVLYRSTELHASDVRDRIYGLLGLSNCRFTTKARREDTIGQPILQIDYSLPPSRVFGDFTKYVLNRDCDLRLLSGFSRLCEGRNSNELDLPSWCPDFRIFKSHQTQEPEIIRSLRGIGYSSTAREVNRHLMHYSVPWQDSDQAGRLRVAGVKIAELDVCIVSKPNELPYTTLWWPSTDFGTFTWAPDKPSSFETTIPHMRREGGNLLDGSLYLRWNLSLSNISFDKSYFPAMSVAIGPGRPVRGDILVVQNESAQPMLGPLGQCEKALILRPLDGQEGFLYVSQATLFGATSLNVLRSSGHASGQDFDIY